MPYTEQRVHIDAPPAVVWSALIDVERWPGWTSSMQDVAWIDEGAFGQDSAARVKAKGIPTASIWRVTRFDQGRSFTWESITPGVRAVAVHAIQAEDGGTRVTLSARIIGIAATLLSPLVARVSRRKVALEAEGLKRYCEQQAAARVGS